MKKLLLILILGLSISQLTAQNVGIGTIAPNSSAQLDISSNNKGLLIPRLSTSQRLAILNAATGLLVFDTDKKTIYMYDGAQWLAMLFAANTINGQTTSTSLAGDYLGISVAISGNYAVVGASGKTVGANQYQGSAYIFTLNGNVWQQIQVLNENDGAAGDFFGYSVAISSTTAVIGAYNKTVSANSMQGAAYVYSLIGGTWQFVKKLTAIDGRANDLFGKSVSISGDTVLIGAPSKTIDNMPYRGKAYIFTNNNGTWNETDLAPADGSYDDQFGTSVSIGYGLIAIGAPGKNSFYPYTLSGGNWLPLPEQTAADIAADDGLGSSIAVGVGANFVAVGAPRKQINGNNNQGAVYIFLPTNPITWQYSRITANDGAADDYFGITIATQDGKIITGASNKNINLNQLQGAAYLLTQNNNLWSQQKIISGDAAAEDYFSNGVGVSGNYLLIGAPGKNTNTGSIYFININNL